jgi:hypothetical protein
LIISSRKESILAAIFSKLGIKFSFLDFIHHTILNFKKQGQENSR